MQQARRQNINKLEKILKLELFIQNNNGFINTSQACKVLNQSRQSVIKILKNNFIHVSRGLWSSTGKISTIYNDLFEQKGEK